MVSRDETERARLDVMQPTAVGESTHITKGLLRLTMACNERCPFCNVPVEDYAKPTPEFQGVLSEVDAFITSGEQTLTVSGGEPTLYRDRLLEVIRRARAGGVPFVEIQTNAVLISDDYARALADAGATSAFVSLLADDAKDHDSLTGLEGAFEKCLAGIDALLEAKISVTLNPVIAHQTQARVSQFVDFVAARLPGVRCISLSAVQPHGRAGKNTELLPDYAVLEPEVRRARERARHHGIMLLNPYCGLPLCVGWDDDASTSVEATEATALRDSGASAQARGIDNRGNKQHGPPCQGCALRTRCGGAWRSYWDVRGGSGLSPPLPRIEPWRRQDWNSPGQRVVYADAGLGSEPLTQPDSAELPSVWLVAHGLRDGELERAAKSGVTDIALWMDTRDALEDDATLSELQALQARQAGWEPQHRLRVVLGLQRLGSFQETHLLLRSYRHVVEAVRLPGDKDARRERFAQAASEELGLSVSVVDLTDPAQSGPALKS